MIRLLLLLGILVMLLVGCGSGVQSPTGTQTAEQALISTLTVTPSPLPLPSYTASPSPALQPSKTRTITLTATDTPIPSPSITPMTESQVTAHPLALDTYNVAMQFKQLARFGQGTLYDIDWSQDGKYLAASTGLGVYLYDTVTFEQVRFIDVNDGATHIDFCPDGNSLAVVQFTHISVWDINSGQKVIDMEGEIEGGIWKLVCGQGGYIAAVGQLNLGAGDAEPQLKVWWASTGRLLYSDERNFLWTHAIDMSPNGNTIAYIGGEGIQLRDIQTYELIRNIPGDYDTVFSRDGTKIFSSSYARDPLSVWMTDLTSGESQQVLNGTKCQYLSLNGVGAVCFGQEEVVQFDPTDGTTLKIFTFDTDIYHAVISPDGRSLAVIEEDTVIVLNTQSEQEVKRISFEPYERMAVGLIRFDGTGLYAAAISNQTGSIQIFDLASGVTLRKIQMSESGINGMAFSPDRTTLASIDENNVLRLWDFQDDIVTYEFDLVTQEARGPLVFSPNGLKLALTDDDHNYIYEFDLQTSYLKDVLYLGNYGWYSYTPDNHLVTWEQDSANIVLKDLSEDLAINLPFSLNDDYSFIETIALSPDGNFQAASNDGAEILVWDLENQILVQTLVGHERRWGDGWVSQIKYLAFNLRSSLLVSTGQDGTTRLWNIHSGLQLQKLNVCCYAEFSPDGRILVTLGEGVIRVWGVPPWP